MRRNNQTRITALSRALIKCQISCEGFVLVNYLQPSHQLNFDDFNEFFSSFHYLFLSTMIARVAPDQIFASLS